VEGDKQGKALLDTAPRSKGDSPQRKNLRIGQYELLRQLGSGGMGTVYLARDTKLARMVALKLLNAPSPHLLARFLIEARATARCTHENIVVIHDVDEIGGEPYMVLEYLDGAPLTHTLAGGKLTSDRAVELIAPVLHALVVAHEAGIVHRDLKPDNIFLTDRGVIKVLDFGIAKLLESEIDAATEEGTDPAEVAARADTAGTHDSSILGTMPYMSPEQWGADEVDHQSDIWAVGVILFEMIAGAHPLAPVTSKGLLAAASQLGKAMPSLRDAAPEAPVELHRIVDRCLRKHKRDRYPSVEALLADLEPLLPRRGRTGASDVSPFPGLTAFQESDADRFFGRSDEISARRDRRVRGRQVVPDSRRCDSPTEVFFDSLGVAGDSPR
jgi:serine/threonine protein kinase